MSTTRLLLIIALFALAGFSIYRKHFRQKQEEQERGQKKGRGKPYLSEFQKDDYEPYSGN
jgi:hypothetical protein